MSHCCSSHSKKGSMNKADMKKDTMPKSFAKVLFGQDSLIGRYLYNLGKADFEKNNGKKKGCC